MRGAREATAYSSSSGVEGGARTYFSERVAASLGFCQICINYDASIENRGKLHEFEFPGRSRVN